MGVHMLILNEHRSRVNHPPSFVFIFANSDVVFQRLDGRTKAADCAMMTDAVRDNDSVLVQFSAGGSGDVMSNEDVG